MSSVQVPFLDLRSEMARIWNEVNASIQGVLQSGQFILGPELTAFEKEVGEFLGTKHAIGLNSGTDALVLGLRALGIGEGDEVITTNFSFFATAESIEIVGAKSVFVDIEPDTFNLDVSQVEARITDRTRAIMPVHLFGHSADMAPLLELAEKHDLRVIEDTAQAFGGSWRDRMLSTLGDVGAHSFFPTKNLGGYGDGGLLCTDRDDVAERVRMLRDHGTPKKFHHVTLGYNSRLDSIQAAVLRVKLRYLEQWNEQRRMAAERYQSLLGDFDCIELPVEKPYAKHVYHQYTIRVKDGRRDEVRDRLNAEGIGCNVYYPAPMHRAPYFDEVKRPQGTMPIAEQACDEVLSLPIGPWLQESQQVVVADGLRRVLG